MTTDLNVNPYYDDFDAQKKFYKILFNPGRAVQARELTQIQSILQNQTKVLADHLFEDGSLVIPGQIAYDSNYDFVKIEDLYLANPIVLQNFVNKIIVGQTSGVKALVVNTVNNEASDPKTLFVKYLNSGTNNVTKTFANGEVLQTEGGTTYYAVVKPTAATGKGSAATIKEGYYYVGGTLAFVENQTLILDKYSNSPSYRVGLEIIDYIVEEGDDSSLLDPAQGTPNFSAPGAHRLSINLVLAKRTLTSTNDEKFVELLRLSNGEILRKVDSPAYSYLEDEMAKRTFEESGNYTVKDFGIDIREHLNNGTNRGVYTAGQGGLETKMALGIEPGIAYVQGKRVENIATQFIDIDKARDVRQVNNSITSAALGNFLLIGETTGATAGNLFNFPDVSNFPAISLRDAVVSVNGTAPGTEIGTARARLIELHSGTAGSGTESYRLYIFDVKMNTGQLFTATRSVFLAGSPAFTANVILNENNVAEIEESAEQCSIFPLQYPVVQTIRDASNSVDTSYDVKRIYSGTTNATGTITFGPLGANEFFSPFATKDYVLVRTDTGAAIDLTGKVTLTGSPVGKSLQLSGLPNTTAIRLQATVQKTVAQEKTKTLQTSSISVTTPTNTISLGRADIFKIVGIYDSRNPGAAATNADLNITDRYTLDNGQRDSHYDIGRIILRPGQSAPTGRLLIEFQFFSHGSGDYFSVDSYTGQVNYQDIPTFTSSTGNSYFLRDCLDFRPRINDAGTGFTGTGSSNIEIIKPDSFIRADFRFYLNRIDKVFVNADGKFGIIKGASDVEPATPADLADAMTFYKLSIRAYTYGAADVIAELVDNRRYTMRDIGRLARRIDNLEYYVSLSLLEKETADIQVIDTQTGLNRFKNGFIVDGFTGHGVGDVLDNDYKCSIDRQNKQLRPGFQNENIGLEYIAGESTNIQKTGDLITLPYTTATIIEQPFASRKENVNPYAIFTFNGRIELTPPNDDWKDTERQPDLNVDVPDNVDLITNLAGRTGITGTQWADWQTSWTGATTTNVTTNTTLEAGRNVAPGGNRWPLREVTVTQTVTSTTVGQTRTGVRTAVIPQTVTRDLGSRVVSVEIIPFIRSRLITFNASRLKPNTRVYPFFDGVSVASFCRPVGGNYGDALITNNFGEVTGEFNIPNTDTLRFRTGERVFRLTDSSTNLDDNTTQAEARYQAQGLLENTQNTILSTRIAALDTQRVNDNRVVTNASTTTSVQTGAWFDPLAQTFLIDSPGGIFITSIDLYFASKDANVPVTVQLRNVINGYPGPFIFPFGEVTLNPSQVNTSADGTVATRFTFPSPVYMLPNTEYCFVILSDSIGYEAYVARIGENEISTNRLISEQPYAGVMFKSQNASTWTADQTQDIKFRINRAIFNTSVNGTVVLKNKAIPVQNLKINPLITTSGSNVIRVHQIAHGLTGGDRTILSGIPAGTHNGIPAAQLNATHVVSNVELNSYTITVATNATASGAIGGNAVQAQRNLQMDVFQPSIQQTVLSQTAVLWEARATSGKHPHGNQTPYVIDSAWSTIQANENNFPVAPRLVASPVNETNSLSGAKSLTLRGTLASSNANISPVIDTQRLSVITVANMCDNPTVGNTSNFVAETSPSGGSAIARYITRRVTLNNSAIALKIFVGVSRPTGSEVELYYRTKTSDDSTPFEQKSWTLANPQGDALISEDPSVFKEYEYLIDDLEPFITFQIKMVMKTNDSTKVPIFTDFRAIALGT